MVQLERFGGRAAMMDTLAHAIADRLKRAATDRSAASLMVSGGRTPGALFEQLRELDGGWDRVTVSLVDERWVAPESPESNEHLVRSTLLKGKAAAAQFVPLKSAHESPTEGQADRNEALKSVPRPFDVVLLGMGEDGHTASLFPRTEELPAGLSLETQETVMALTPLETPAGPVVPRMTMTLSAILDAKVIILLLTGEAKLTTYETALAGDDALAMPVRAVLRQTSTPVEVYWAP